jgi:hypothetical protein
VAVLRARTPTASDVLPGPGTLGQPAQPGKCGPGAGRGLPPLGTVVHARGVHDPQGGPRSTGRGLAAALGTWVVTLAGPALAEAAEPEAAEPEADEGQPAEPTSAPKPPRIDGTYLGGTMLGGIGLVRVNTFDTPGAFASFGGTFTVGQMVFPWLGLGLHGGGGGAVHSQDGVRQKLGQGHLGVQFKFVPLPKRRVPLSLLASFGFGGGAVRQEGIAKRSGFGGAQFGAAVRYELFPWAERRRPYRGGGFGLGPELGWVGFTPAAPGRPMSNVLYLAISATFYFGS